MRIGKEVVKLFPIATVDSLYAVKSSVAVSEIVVSDDDVGSFFRRLGTLERRLATRVNDEYWRIPIRLLRRVRFRMAAVPLPFRSEAICSSSLSGEITLRLRDAGHLYPDVAEILECLADDLIRLQSRKDCPLLEATDSDKNRNWAMLVKESWIVTPVRNYIQFLPSSGVPQVLTSSQLVEPDLYSKLVIYGPSRWYPPHVLLSPRAPRVDIVRFACLADTVALNVGFLKPSSKVPVADVAQRHAIGEALLPDEVLPTLDWESISNRLAKARSDESALDESEAILFVLEDNAAVLLDSAPGTGALILDLDGEAAEEEDADSRIVRVHTSDIQPGMFVLLRTQGGGDYLVPIADQILGPKADEVKSRQALWKQRLRGHVRSKGLDQVSSELRGHGASRANPVNVGNWTSDRTIRPQDYSDFAAIMSLVGLGDKTSQYWDSATMLETARRSAGFHIRRLLLNQVRSSATSELRRHGRVDFDLGESDGGTLTAFRVKAISPNSYVVPVARVGRLLENDAIDELS